jgi:hypothetical protein
VLEVVYSICYGDDGESDRYVIITKLAHSIFHYISGIRTPVQVTQDLPSLRLPTQGVMYPGLYSTWTSSMTRDALQYGTRNRARYLDITVEF